MNYAIILAGGIGSRFWPLSKDTEPKQFLQIFTKKTLLEETIFRIKPLFKKENIYIATHKDYCQRIKKICKQIKLKNFFFEPKAKNTLAPIVFLTYQIYQLDKEAIIAVFPSDHIIKNPWRFRIILKKAIQIAEKGYIITLGIKPKRPETGYGYIKVDFQDNLKVFKVDRFIEKPSLLRVKRFIKDKRYYWNSGIFIFKAEAMLKETKKYQPKLYRLISGIKNKNDLNRFWQRLPALSIDYGIMEKTKKAMLIPTDFGWLDLGSWQAIEELFKKDRSGNILKGNCLDIGSKNISVWADKRLVATIGLNNLVVVDTDEAVLICAKDKVQQVKRIVQKLEEKK